MLSDRGDDYVFYKIDPDNPGMSFPSDGGLYVHVPFCRNLCPYCPYYKERFDESWAEQYKVSILKEIEAYGRRVKGAHFTSLYFGGGTPTLIVDDLPDIVRATRKHLNFDGLIGLETTPQDLSRKKLAQLKDLGVNLLSVGVQSFQDAHLRGIGRDYSGAELQEKLEALKEFRFNTVNFDMIFVFPQQTLKDVQRDLEQALSYHPQQITYYPLFTFPYTPVGEFKKLSGLKLPHILKRREMYYYIHDYLQARGYKRSSVWSFNRDGSVPYSSVTRDHYLGLGPGAGSYTKEGFYFNTFSVQEYVRMIQEENRLPLALKMAVSERMAKLFWLYWRLYETEIPPADYERLFQADVRSDFSAILNVARMLGFMEKGIGRNWRLNQRGTHWIHLLQNYFALNYVTEIWSAFKRDPHPEVVAI